MRPVSILCGNGGLFLDFELERGLITSDFQRSPAVPLSPTARAEVAFLGQRLEAAQGGAFVKVLR